MFTNMFTKHDDEIISKSSDLILINCFLFFSKKKIERRDQQSAQILRTAIAKAENTCPGLMFEIILSILKRIDSSIDITEALLKLQGNSPEFEEYRIKRQEEPFQDLNKKAVALRRILSRIPDEINDRKTFLETIK